MSTQKQGSGDRVGEEREDLNEGAALSSDEARATDEERATTLDLPPEELSALARAFYELTLDYIGSPNALPVFPATDAARLAEIFRRPLPEEGCGLESLARDCREVIQHSRQNGHPRMFGYVASPSAPAGTLASLLAAALNSNVTSWRSAPAATEVERTVVGWLAELIGFKGEGLNQSCGGLLTSGGSMANLDALFVAHRAKSREAAHNPSREGLWNASAPMTLYASDQVHLSIPKAADILGIGREQVRLVPSDEHFRLDVRALGERVEADGRAGLRPFCVVANAGTVSTGAVDPLDEAARVAREHDLWFHVDGAYGALAASDASKRALFRGLEEADSVSLDPHKWLYAPLDCGCLIFREPERARAAFAGTEEGYIKVFERQPEEAFAFWDYGIELSRPFRALKVWAILRYYGARRVADAIAEDCALAEHLARLVRDAEDFELLAPVTLGICCFRYLPAGARRELEEAKSEEERERTNARLDALNERVMQRVQRGGAAYLSNAALRGRFALRASITNFRTTRRDLRTTLDAVRAAALEVGRE
ncbi:MAG: pyridoxal-dependent decarboxylase [Acidobacteriota bacterium]|nr:pyridoxal-dependent decarboxylase [Acidobacteriota bacterium]MDQ5837594.1 pyridoxal-dependent decarboxylase [Acidobacteriota bacterium]